MRAWLRPRHQDAQDGLTKACHQALPDAPDGHRDDLGLRGHRDDRRLWDAHQGDQGQDGLGQLDALQVLLACRLADLSLRVGHLGVQEDVRQGVSADHLGDLPQRGARLGVQGDVRQWLAFQ